MGILGYRARSTDEKTSYGDPPNSRKFEKTEKNHIFGLFLSFNIKILTFFGREPTKSIYHRDQ